MWHFMFQMSKEITCTGYYVQCAHVKSQNPRSRACVSMFNVEYTQSHSVVRMIVHKYVLIYLRFTPHTCIQRFLHSSYKILLPSLPQQSF